MRLGGVDEGMKRMEQEEAVEAHDPMACRAGLADTSSHWSWAGPTVDLCRAASILVQGQVDDVPPRFASAVG